MEKFYLKFLFKIFLLVMLILFSFSSISFAQINMLQYQIIILPTTNITDNPDVQWMQIGIEKSLEFSIENISLFGILKDEIIQDTFESQYRTNNPYQMNLDVISAHGKVFRGDYIITSQYSYNSSTNSYNLDLNLIEVESESILQSFNKNGNIKEILNIGKEVLDYLIEYHSYEINKYEKAALRINEITMDERASKEFCIGYAAYLQGNYDYAIEHISRSLVHYNKFSDAFRMLGIIRYITGNVTLAEKRFQDAVFAKASNFRVWEGYGDLKANKLDYSTAIKYYNKALQLRGKDTYIFSKAALIYYKNGLFADAKNFYEKAYELDQNNVKALEGLVKIMAYQIKDFDKAFILADKLLALDNDNFVAYTVLANAFGVKKDYGNAINMLVQALKRNPGFMDGHYMIGLMYTKYYLQVEKKMLDKAKNEELTDEERVMTLDKLQTYHEQALKAFKYCISKKHKIPNVYIETAKLYAIVRNGDKAAEYLQLAFENGFTNIDSIIFEKLFDRIKDNPRFKKVLTYWYNKLKA